MTKNRTNKASGFFVLSLLSVKNYIITEYLIIVSFRRFLDHRALSRIPKFSCLEKSTYAKKFRVRQKPD